MAKILKEEMQQGIITKIQDDIMIGGDSQLEAAHNYARVLNKLHLANLRVEPQKVVILPDSADIAAWSWKEGGTITVSPHRRNALTNMKPDNITK